MLTLEQYNEVVKYRGILELFNKTGEYIGGIQDLVKYLEPNTQTSCPSCMAAFLINTYNRMIEYEASMQSM